jgi:hypothetical protein
VCGGWLCCSWGLRAAPADQCGARGQAVQSGPGLVHPLPLAQHHVSFAAGKSSLTILLTISVIEMLNSHEQIQNLYTIFTIPMNIRYTY